MKNKIVLFLLVICVLFIMTSCDENDINEVINNPVSNQEALNNETEFSVSDIEMSVADRMKWGNAVIVKLGEIIENNVYSDTSPMGWVDYVAVSIEIIEVFDKTFILADDIKSDTLPKDRSELLKMKSIYIPELYLDNIKENDTVLLFLEQGLGYTDIMAPQDRYGFNLKSFYLEQEDLFIIPMFPIIDDKLVIPNSFYDKNELGNYKIMIMNDIDIINKEISALNPQQIFKSDMSVEDLKQWFDIVMSFPLKPFS